jgi:hypothetical protein
VSRTRGECGSSGNAMSKEAESDTNRRAGPVVIGMKLTTPVISYVLSQPPPGCGEKGGVLCCPENRIHCHFVTDWLSEIARDS